MNSSISQNQYPDVRSLHASFYYNLKSTSLTTRILISLLLFYLTLVRFLRFHRRKSIIRYVRSHRPLTPASAQPVVHDIVQLEFPTMHEKALQFALFRTYGIPTISDLLRKTSLFSAAETAGRRYVDTKVLIAEFMGRKWGTPDWIVPMARLNAIHGYYRGSGRILEQDMLYTLILFAQQPFKWIDRFEWRRLSHEERDALGTFWRGVGEAMEINHSGLGLRGWQEGTDLPVTANGRGKGTWKDGAEWLAAADEWAEQYERKAMLPAESNVEVAEQTTRLLLYEVPDVMLPLGRQIVAALMDQRLRRAMEVSPPPIWVHCAIMTMFKIRKFLLRWLMPPRPQFLKVAAITDVHEKNVKGRHQVLHYDNYPYFVAPTLVNRYGFRAWLRWLSSRPLPGDRTMDPHGYVPVEIGPGIGKAKAEQAKHEHQVEDVLAGRGCPFAFSN